MSHLHSYANSVYVSILFTLQSLMLVTSLNPVSFLLSILKLPNFYILLKLNFICLFQKIGYDKAAAVAKTAHKEGTTLKVMISCHTALVFVLHILISF